MVEVVKDEADKKREEMLDKYRRGDPGSDLTQIVGGDKKFRYRGVNKRPERVARAKARGFETVPSDDPASFLVQMGASGKEFGDLVLMREPMELYEMKKSRQKSKRAMQDQAYQDGIDDTINRIAREAGAVGPGQSAVTTASDD